VQRLLTTQTVVSTNHYALGSAKGIIMATKKMNPFGMPDTKKNEAKEKKMAPGKKAYAAMEKKMEPGMHKGKKK